MGVSVLIAVVLCLLALINVGVSGHGLHSRELGIADITPCGMQCLLVTLPSSGCTLDNTNCLCTSQKFGHSNTACLLANCTMADNLGSAKVYASMCNLSDESQTKHIFWYTGVTYFISFTFVALRTTGKLLSQGLTADDWIVISALLLCVVPIGCVMKMGQLGLGEHVWNLRDGKLREILKLVHVSWSVYIPIICLIKISFIMFLLRIFQTTRFRVCAYAILVFVVVSNLVVLFMTIFVCTPVDAFWNRDKKGKCMDISQLALANSGSAIVQDLILLVLPLPFISKLQMQCYRKIAVCLMFAVGSFGCIATLLRLKSLRTFKVSADPSWDYVSVMIWTDFEVAAAIGCVSLPSIRLLLARILPYRFRRFVTQNTNSSRCRSNPLPSSDPRQRQWKKPASWMTVSLMPGERVDSASTSFGNDIWEGRPISPASLQTPKSPQSNHSDSWTRAVHSPFDEESGHDHIEMLRVTELKKDSSGQRCKSCGSLEDDPTALPALGNIGCLPERTYSNITP